MKEKIGHYELKRIIAKGGMGEVYLAYDPVCKRSIALKCVSEKLINHKIIQQRFLKEAHIASKLTHPNIIPIYNISKDGDRPYYTMPYIAGKTLKEILIDALKEQRGQKNVATVSGSIPALIHIFQTICEAVAYAHNEKIVHRDLKPENILVGRFGEVLIFDWGVADNIDKIAKEKDFESDEDFFHTELTSPGKIIGTLTFMSPERIAGEKASYISDIYSLGVMLYMILTLKLPFKRKKVNDLKEKVFKEVLPNPVEVAPYRDIPHALVKITQKCLEVDPNKRYQNIESLLKDLKEFTGGHSEWIQAGELNVGQKRDWGLHENLLIAKHQAISQKADAVQWICLMTSKESFSINSQLRCKVELKADCEGIGLLMNGTFPEKRLHLIEGYYIWLSSTSDKPSCIYRNSVQVLEIPNLNLTPNRMYELRFEKASHYVTFYLDDIKKVSYLSYLPLPQSHVGVLYKDTEFTMGPLFVSVASPSLVINCLDVPNAFLAQKDYDSALKGFRHIGRAFPGRHESREALFLAGMTLIHKGLMSKTKKLFQKHLEEALIEFENLRHTPGAPLEYLGKSLVYGHFNESGISHNDEDEVKCLELAIRRYPDHPLLYLIYDHIIYRVYQCSHQRRIGTYQFMLLALRYNSITHRKQKIDPLVLNLVDKRRMLFFLSPLPESATEEEKYQEYIIQFSFLLDKTYVIEEIFEETSSILLKENCIICLFLLGDKEGLRKFVQILSPQDYKTLSAFENTDLDQSYKQFISSIEKKHSLFQESLTFLMMTNFTFNNRPDLILALCKFVINQELKFKYQERFQYGYILALLLNNEIDKANGILREMSALCEKSSHPYHFLYGCYLYAKKGFEAAQEFFSKEIELPIPEIPNLPAMYITNKLDLKRWSKEAFLFEQNQLYKYLYYFYKIGRNESKAKTFLRLWRKFRLDA